MTRVVQLTNGVVRRVALVDEPYLRLLVADADANADARAGVDADEHGGRDVRGDRADRDDRLDRGDRRDRWDREIESLYALAAEAIRTSTPLSELAQRCATGEALDYDSIYAGASPWRLLSPIDHPDESSRCIVSGTGLTHIGSARDRHNMHDDAARNAGATAQKTPTSAAAAVMTSPETEAAAAPVTDSMRMFEAGLVGGRPAPGLIGVAPEWFYKGTGSMLRAHGEALDVPAYAEDGGEEAELAGVYVIDPEGRPRRIGLAAGNEFSDHRFERKNYLNLAGSKLRACSLGPELVLAPAFDAAIPGEVWIERAGTRVWWKRIASGEAEMSHSLRNIEHHHFKFEAHRRPGDLHVHYFGAHSLSFGEGVALRDGDIMVVRFDGFGRALRNVVRVDSSLERPVEIDSLG
jgi:hypothetical protein